MDYLRELTDNAFELAIVDPPYNVGASDGNFGSRASCASYKDPKMHHYSNHDSTPGPEYFKQLFRVSQNQIIWGSNYYPENLHHSGAIVWDKLTTGPLSDCEIAFQSFSKLVTKFTSQWSGFKKGGETKNHKIRVHPNQKPVKLYKWLLTNYAKEGDRILDTHLGSGSSAIASHELGFDFVGIELDEDYFKVAQKRFKQMTAQKDLFR